jgi:hypothetical protein
MKKSQNLKPPLRRSKPKAKSASLKVKLVFTRRSPLKHLRIVEHKHTGKLLHRTHTSHAALLIILIIVGIFLFASQEFASADTQTASQDVSVSAVVSGNPPTIGAAITSPTDGTAVTAPDEDISGTCQDELFVVIYDNGTSAGSTDCTAAGLFDLTIQLVSGQNALQALNYDGLNQPGPATPTITVTYTPPVVTTTPAGTTVTPVTIPPVLAAPQPVSQLANPAIIPAVTAKKDCDTYNGTVSTSSSLAFSVQVVCLQRDLNPLESYKLGLLVQGGTPPYALNITWGTSKLSNRLFSVAHPSYFIIEYAYPVAGIYTIKINANDNVGNSVYAQAVAEVNGEPQATIVSTINKDIIDTNWFTSPVPLYLIAVTLLAGFWVGDLFDRKFGTQKTQTRKRRTA